MSEKPKTPAALHRRIWFGDACDEWALSPWEGWEEYISLQEAQERERLLTEALESIASEKWPDHIVQDGSRASLQALIEWNMDVAAKVLAKIRGTNV